MTKAGTSATNTGDFDWGWRGADRREIILETVDGQRIELLASGGTLVVDGVVRREGARHEYRDIYAHFAGLLAEGESDVDGAPLELVADIFLAGEAVAAEAVRGGG